MLEKLAMFRSKKELDNDPLVRYCIRAGCDGWLRAPDYKAKKI